MPRARIPLAGSLISRNNDAINSYAKDQVFKNCYAEVAANPVTGQRTIFCNKRPGVKQGNSAASTYIPLPGAPCWWSGFSAGPKALFAFSVGTNARVYDAGGNLIGNTVTASGGAAWSYITETLISGVANLTWVLQNASGIYYAYFIAEGGGSWTEITSANYPINQTPALATVGEMVHMDGYPFILDSKGNVWNGDLNSLANWSATSFINASSMPDGGVGLARTKTLIVAFGRSSVEFFRNAGNQSGSPLSRIPEAAQKIGAYAGVTSGFYSLRSIMTAGDSIFFLGIDQRSGDVGVYIVSGTTISKISTSSIDRILNSSVLSTALSNIYIAGSFSAHGMAHVMVNVIVDSATRSYCYCVDSNFWWEFVQPNADVPTACLGGSGDSFFTKYGAASSPNVMGTFGGASPVYQDFGSAYSALIRTSPLDFGSNKRKLYRAATLIGDKQTVSATTEILWSDDDYTTMLAQQNSYLNLPGASGDYASTPDAAALDIAGDIEFIARVSLTDWTPGSAQTIISKCSTAGNQVSFLMSIDTLGRIVIQNSPDGTSGATVSGTSTVPVAASNGDIVWLKANLDVTDGSGNRVYTFYTALDQADIPTTWTALGSVPVAGITSIFNSTAALTVSGINSGTAMMLNGRVYAAYLYNGIGGSLAASFRISDASPRLATFVSGLTGEVWTINGNAAVICSNGVDMSTAVPRMTRLGPSRRRAFEIIDSANRPWRVEALELEYDEANS